MKPSSFFLSFPLFDNFLTNYVFSFRILSKIYYGDLCLSSEHEDPNSVNPSWLNLLEKSPQFLSNLLKDSICICFDCAFDDLMKSSEIESAAQQILYAYGANCKFGGSKISPPFFFSVTGIKLPQALKDKRKQVFQQFLGDERFEEKEQAGNGGILMERLYNKLGSEKWFIDFSEKEFFEHFKEQFENGDIIYLTADVPGMIRNSPFFLKFFELFLKFYCR